VNACLAWTIFTGNSRSGGSAQLLETELGNMLLVARCLDEGLLENKNPARASDILSAVNRHTLGQLLKSLNNHTESLVRSTLFSVRRAMSATGCPFVLREHNFRRNSDEGRALMLEDLKGIHSALLEATQAVLALKWGDLEVLAGMKVPTRHLPI